MCRGNKNSSPPLQTTLDRHRPPYGLWFVSWLCLLLVSSWAAAAQRAPALAVLPIYDGSGIRSFFQFNTGNGEGLLIDRLRDPLQVRARVVQQNPYREIGRPLDQPAIAGEILLAPIRSSDGSTRAAFFVEASTGYVAFFDQAGRGGKLGEIQVVLGRPFQEIASGDGNYAMLMRRGGSGRTDGAYVYHATSGRALLYRGLRQLTTDSTPVAVRNLPQLSGKVAAIDLQSAREDTRAFLVADGGNGDLYFFELDPGNDVRVTVRKSRLNLTEVFPELGAQATARRFLLSPLVASDDRTQHVFVLDATSGEMALVENLDGSRPVLRKIVVNLYESIRFEPSSESTVWSAVPNLASNGQTIGIWLLDSLTRTTVYVDNPDSPGQTVIRRVAIGG